MKQTKEPISLELIAKKAISFKLLNLLLGLKNIKRNLYESLLLL